MSLTGIDVVPVPVRDQAKAAAWFGEVLGFQPHATEELGPGQTWIELALPAGGPKISLVNWLPSLPAGALQMLVVNCDDIDATKAELEARGVTFFGEIQRLEWGSLVPFGDLEGNGWVLVQPASA